MLYLILKWLHVLLAIAAIGANITYAIWLARGRRAPQHLAFALRGVKILDDRVANPSYGFLLVTGVAMTFVAGIPLTTPWILISLIIYVILVVVGAAGYTPTLRRQLQLAEEGKFDTPEYAALAKRGTVLGIVLAVLVVIITFFMVVKPMLW
jgi:uncharacterized membrane protein